MTRIRGHRRRQGCRSQFTKRYAQILLLCLCGFLLAACRSNLPSPISSNPSVPLSVSQQEHQSGQSLPPTMPTAPVTVRLWTEGPLADPAFAVDSKGTLYAAWWELVRRMGEIFISRSLDGGATWSPATNVSNTPLGSEFPSLAVGPQDQLYLVWEDLSVVPLSGEVVFAKSSDGGGTWSSPINVSKTRSFSTRPSIAVGPTGSITVLWLEGENQLFFARSSDGGDNWTAARDISGGHPPLSIYSPSVVEDSRGSLFAAWSVANEKSYLTHSPDGGIRWSKPRPVTDSSATGGAELAIGHNGRLYAVWSGPSAFTTDIFMSYSTDGGSTFSERVNLSQSPQVTSLNPRIAVGPKGTIFVLWHEVLAGDTEVFLARSTDEGRTFAMPENVSRTPGNSLAPRLAIDRRGAVYALWEQGVKEAILATRVQ